MENEKIQKLLESSFLEDVLIGLEFIKHRTFEDIYNTFEGKKGYWMNAPDREKYIRIKSPCEGGFKCSYQLLDSWIHINSGWVHIYNEGTPGVKYIKL